MKVTIDDALIYYVFSLTHYITKVTTNAHFPILKETHYYLFIIERSISSFFY